MWSALIVAAVVALLLLGRVAFLMWQEARDALHVSDAWRADQIDTARRPGRGRDDGL